MATNQQKVDAFINKTDEGKQWQDEYKKLRTIILETGLTEDFKWMHPCYTHNGSNVVIVHGFKDYCALLFTKGVLLKDEANILIQQTENVQAGRQLRFKNLDEIIEMQHIIKSYLEEAIEVEEAGLEVEYKDTSEYDYPDELISIFEDKPDFAEAFEALTPGRKRGYLLHFSSAKQSATRVRRIEKSIPQIFEGKGFNER